MVDENYCPLKDGMCEGNRCQFWHPGAEDCLLAMVLERSAKLIALKLSEHERQANAS